MASKGTSKAPSKNPSAGTVAHANDPPPKSGGAGDGQQQPATTPQGGGGGGGGGGCLKFCCNTAEGTCLGRSPLSWFKIFIFYIIFYVALFAFFCVYLFGVLYSFDEVLPMAINRSIIGSPGLGFRPNNDDPNSALIWFDQNDNTTYLNYIYQLESYTHHKGENSTLFYQHCHNYLEKLPKTEKKMCKVYSDTHTGPGADPNATGIPLDWGPCNPVSKFGYNVGKPCVLIRLNRIIDWVPDKIFDNNEKNGTIKKKLGYLISDLEVYKTRNATVREKLKKNDTAVCISCTGETDFDSEMMGDIDYYPGGHRPAPCIPLFYFPYRNQEHYLSPFIFVHFKQLPLGIFIQVRCTAHNTKIKEDKENVKHGIGVTKFELLVENLPKKQ